MSGVKGHAAELKEAIERIANPFGIDYGKFVQCEVVSVDVDARTCVCKPVNDISEADIEGVNLSAVPNDGELCVPDVGSTVLVVRFFKQEPYVVKFSDLEKWQIVANEVVLNGDGYGGVVIADEVASYVNNAINTMKAAVVAGFAALPPANFGSGAISAFNGAMSSLLPLNSLDLQNPNVKHGQ